MNILVVNWQDITNPRGGGAEVHFHEIFRRIAAAGHGVTLACSAYPGAPEREVLNGIRILRRGSRSFFNFQFPSFYRSITGNEVFDVVVEDLNKLPFFTPWYVQSPVAGIGHHLFGTSIFREANPASAAYVYLFERAALRLYRHRIPFMVVSPSTRDEFLRLGFPSDRLAVIHNCVDHSRYLPDPVRRSPSPLIGYFGRLKRYKNVGLLLRAAASVVRDVPALRVVVMGEGDDRPRLERMARDLGIAGSVTFTGFLPEADVVRELQRWWFCVAPSSKEGWGLTVVEANACGTPAIASDVPGLRDAVRDGTTGLLYPYADEKVLEEDIRKLLDDPGLLQRLADGGIAWAKSFSWENAARDTLTFLQRTIDMEREKHPRVS